MAFLLKNQEEIVAGVPADILRRAADDLHVLGDMRHLDARPLIKGNATFDGRTFLLARDFERAADRAQIRLKLFYRHLRRLQIHQHAALPSGRAGSSRSRESRRIVATLQDATGNVA
ncbi:MAG TPA: hypothetical protein P5256_06590 [Beijerinckiaceae bacterium]|nr:hypothetical protein [Beijerinckiaceae bacterium]